jgi:hypothetical protein
LCIAQAKLLILMSLFWFWSRKCQYYQGWNFGFTRRRSDYIFSTHRMESVEELCDHIVLNE